METSSENKTIDIAKILQQKMGNKARFVPTFLVNWLKNIVHEEESNQFLWEVREKQGVEWLESCIEYLKLNFELKGIENLPDPNDGHRYTFVSNHPLGGPDGIALGSIIGRHYNGNIRYLVNDLLMNIPNLAPLCIPINMTGGKKQQSLQKVSECFNSDSPILMFPAAVCSRKIKGEIHDLPWKKAFIKKSIETHRDVVPIHFEGRNSERFYRIASICKVLRLKFNLAMLFLPDEMYRNKGKTFQITIGKPIPWQTFDSSQTASEWAAYVEELVYKL